MLKSSLWLGAALLTVLPFAAAMADPADPLEHIDSDMRAVLNAQSSLGSKPIEILPPALARTQPTPADGAQLVMVSKGMDPNDDMGVMTQDMTISGGIKVRVYVPKMSDGKPMPVVVYYHGGGFVIADNNVYDATPRETAKNVHAIVVSVEYRKAPEYKFPAAHMDAFNAYKWVVANASSIGGDPRRIAVMGESAGGNLAIDTSIAARDAHIQMPVYQALIYPMAGVDPNTRSYTENATAKPLNKAMMMWFFKYASSDPSDLNDPRLNVIGGANLSDLPPTTVILAGIDPLRSEGHVLGVKLKQAGVKVDMKTYHGVTHEFFGMGAVVGAATDAEDRVNEDLTDAFEN